MRFFQQRTLRTYKTVSFLDTVRFTDDEIIKEALPLAGEDRSSLFGWTVERAWSDDLDYEVATATLHTD